MKSPNAKPDKAKKDIKPRGRPRKRDIMNLQGSIPATPEELAKVILSTPPRQAKA